MDERQEDIRACVDLKGRELMARKWRVSKTTLTDWYNGKYPASDRAWFKAVTLLEAEKTGIPGIPLAKLRRMCGVPLANLQERAIGRSESLCVEERPYFVRFAQAMAERETGWLLAASLAATSKKSSKQCPNSDISKQSLGFLREKYDLGGKDSFYKAEAIWESRREDLMQVVNSGALSLHAAHSALTLGLDPVMTAVLLAQGKAVLLAFLKKQRTDQAKAHR